MALRTPVCDNRRRPVQEGIYNIALEMLIGGRGGLRYERGPQQSLQNAYWLSNNEGSNSPSGVLLADYGARLRNANKCEGCQAHGNDVRRAPTELHNLTTP